jgi:lipopolysaccharide export system protein LptC
MQNTLIILLVIIVVVVGWILYLYKDEITHKYNKNSWKVKEDVSHAVKEIKEDIKN